jgi:protein gp37
VVGAAFAYVREAIAPDTLGALEGQQVRILPQWIEDIGSVANDPEASFFFVEMRNRESVQHAVERGLSLPLVRRDDLLIHPDRERRSPFGK